MNCHRGSLLAAAALPEVYGDIATEMDATGKVAPVYNKLAERAAGLDAPAVDLPDKPSTKAKSELGDDFATAVPPARGASDAVNVRTTLTSMMKMPGANTALAHHRYRNSLLIHAPICEHLQFEGNAITS